MTAEGEIRRRIAELGRLTFADFMDIALYWPEGGYYRSIERIGATGDFYTSPLAHPAFGALLAAQLYQMWQLLGQPDTFVVMEAGAGNGALCGDIVAYTAHLPSQFRQSLHYVCIDQRPFVGMGLALLTPVGMPQINRIISDALPFRGATGCVLTNELLDSFPAHQVTISEGQLREVYVTLFNGKLQSMLGEPSTPRLASRLEEAGINLVEGQIAEINLELEHWVEAAASALDVGFVLTIDYGQPAEELYSAERRFRGSLTTYYQHIQTDSPFRHIGNQDLTTQVDFTSLVNAGLKVGLEPLGFTSQRQFLNNLGLPHWQQRLLTQGLRARELQANRAGMLDLIRLGGLGDFKALAQGKNVGNQDLWGFKPTEEAARLVADLPVPLLTPAHLSLLAGRYPQAGREFEFEMESLWQGEDEETKC